jgi:alpha-tubulin suppressor-like RCC1 family protein
LDRTRRLAKQTCTQSLFKILLVSQSWSEYEFKFANSLNVNHFLKGWNVTDIGCGYTSSVISADDSLIAWGASPTFGELGLGDLQKSSAQPKEVTKMSEMKIPQIAMGYSHTLMLVNTDDEKTKVKYDKLNEFVVD